MNINRFSLGPLQTNSYLIAEGEECLIIDPADDAAFLLEEIQRKNLKLVGLLATHGHFDHVMAVGEMQLSFPLSLYIGKEDQFLLDRLGATAKHFLGYDPKIIKPKRVEYLNEGEMTFGQFSFRAISTPGHTPGSFSFHFKSENCLFTGDILFKGAIGSYDHAYSSKTDLFHALAKLKEAVGEAEVYPGHGEPTLLSSELRALGL